MLSQRFRRFSLNLYKFFKHRTTDRLIIGAVAISSFIAVTSLFSEDTLYNDLNLVFSFLFFIELSLRFFTYNKKVRSEGKSEYLKEWWLDWIAIIPWDILLGLCTGGAGPSVARLLRLPRVIRILRFRHVQRSRTFKVIVYRIKRLIEASIVKQLAVLGFLSSIIITIFTMFFNFIGSEFGHGDNLWFSVISMFSSDSLFEVAEQSGEIKILVLILSSIGIIVFNGILIAIIVGRLMDHLNELKRGHGEVYEKNHIILLGRSEFVPHILDELDIHCRIERKLKKVVVIRETLDDNDDLLLKSRPRVEVIPRLGGVWSTESLERISFLKSEGVIVFGGESESYDDQRFNDSLVTKTLVSINSLIKKKDRIKNNVPNIVLNYTDPVRAYYAKNYLKRDSEKNGKSFSTQTNPVFFDPVYYTAKMFSCLCANPHSYSIYNELLTAEGSEFHRVPSKFPAGTVFGQIIDKFPKGIPVGYINGDGDGKCRMIPDDDEVIPDKSKIIVLAPNSFEASSYNADFEKSLIGETNKARCIQREYNAEGVGIIGVNDKLPRIVQDLKKQGRSPVYVIDNQSEKEFHKWYKNRLLSLEKKNEEIDRTMPLFVECHFKSEKEVEETVPAKQLSTVIILADELLLKEKTADQIDADTFSRLLMIQHLFHEQQAEGQTNLIVEVLTKDTELAVSQFEKCSHVVGPLFIGRLLTTFLLYPFLEEVFYRLIKSGEIDIESCSFDKIRSLQENLKPEATFKDLLLNRPENSIPIGWVLNGSSSAKKTGINNSHREVVLNPDKNRKVPEKAEIIYISREKK
jgi:hypothetical protein